MTDLSLIYIRVTVTSAPPTANAGADQDLQGWVT